MEQILEAGQEVELEGEAVPAGESSSKGKAKQGKKAPVKSKQPPLVSIVSIVGGLSVQKQRRLLTRGCDILVATPGRLWDLCQEVGLGSQQPRNPPLTMRCIGRRSGDGYQADQVSDRG